MLDFLTLFFSLVEFQGDKLAGLGVQVPWQEWAEICNQEKHNQEHTGWVAAGRSDMPPCL